ncbi:hypothetical protein Bbelb_336170 [Branchiostoma belcheri]|nr:hypothetical protein Bbelb_336170 [Branchiostoma belcheri]
MSTLHEYLAHDDLLSARGEGNRDPVGITPPYREGSRVKCLSQRRGMARIEPGTNALTTPLAGETLNDWLQSRGTLWRAPQGNATREHQLGPSLVTDVATTCEECGKDTRSPDAEERWRMPSESFDYAYRTKSWPGVWKRSDSLFPLTAGGLDLSRISDVQADSLHKAQMPTEGPRSGDVDQPADSPTDRRPLHIPVIIMTQTNQRVKTTSREIRPGLCSALSQFM